MQVGVVLCREEVGAAKARPANVEVFCACDLARCCQSIAEAAVLAVFCG